MNTVVEFSLYVTIELKCLSSSVFIPIVYLLFSRTRRFERVFTENYIIIVRGPPFKKHLFRRSPTNRHLFFFTRLNWILAYLKWNWNNDWCKKEVIKESRPNYIHRMIFKCYNIYTSYCRREVNISVIEVLTIALDIRQQISGPFHCDFERNEFQSRAIAGSTDQITYTRTR